MNQTIKNSVIFICLAFLSEAPPANAGPSAEEVLELAVDAGNWLAAQARTQPSGIAWPANAHSPDVVAYDLGSGTAGIVVYYLSLYSATGNERYLELAASGGTYLASLLDDSEIFGTGSRRASLYSGVAGIGVALTLLADHRPEFSADVAQVIMLLDKWSVVENSGVRWSDEFNDLLYGDAGTILFLAWRMHLDNDLRAGQLAEAAARFLVAQAEDGDRGRYWLFRRSKTFNLPGFSHGTAGVSYVLGSVGSISADPVFNNAAAEGFAYIESIAEVSAGQIRIPYGWPEEDWRGLYEFGWAHGLVGSNAFFTRMQQVGINTRDAARYGGLIVHTLSTIGLPGTPSEPFAEPATPLDLRFGRASVMSLLSDYGEGIETRDAIWHELVNSAIRERGMAHWEVDAPEFMGGGRAAFNGIFHGTAGIGHALLRLHAALVDCAPYVAMPDDPHAWSP